MGSRRGNPVHYSIPGELVLGCGLGARRRRRTAVLAAVECSACRASFEFQRATRAEKRLRQYQEGRGTAGRVESLNVSTSQSDPETSETCSGCTGSLRWDFDYPQADGADGAWVCIGCHQLPKDCECEPYPLEAELPGDYGRRRAAKGVSRA